MDMPGAVLLSALMVFTVSHGVASDAPFPAIQSESNNKSVQTLLDRNFDADFAKMVDLGQRLAPLHLDMITYIFRDGGNAETDCQTWLAPLQQVICIVKSGEQDTEHLRWLLFHEFGHYIHFNYLIARSSFTEKITGQYHVLISEQKAKRDQLKKDSHGKPKLIEVLPLELNIRRFAEMNEAYKTLMEPYAELWADLYATVILQNSSPASPRDFKKTDAIKPVKYEPEPNSYVTGSEWEPHGLFNGTRSFLWKNYLEGKLADKAAMDALLSTMVVVMNREIDAQAQVLSRQIAQGIPYKIPSPEERNKLLQARIQEMIR